MTHVKFYELTGELEILSDSETPDEGDYVGYFESIDEFATVLKSNPCVWALLSKEVLRDLLNEVKQ